MPELISDEVLFQAFYTHFTQCGYSKWILDDIKRIAFQGIKCAKSRNGRCVELASGQNPALGPDGKETLR